MTPPEDREQGERAEAPGGPPAVSLCVIARRADFLKAAAARRQGTGGFLLQARDRADGDAQVRVGFTATKKIGNAVMRNRAKRRLREVARQRLPVLGLPGWDYVLVARPGATVIRDFGDLLSDLEVAIRSVHRPPRAAPDGPRP